MTGQMVSPRRRASSISSTATRTPCSTTAKTSSTVRPEAAMRARSAVLIARIADLRSAGVCSQCGRTGRVVEVEYVGADMAAELLLVSVPYLENDRGRLLCRQVP